MALVCLTTLAAPVKKTSSLEKGQQALKNQQWTEATRHFNAVIEQDADHAFAAYAYLSSMKLSQEQPQEAIDLMNKAVECMNANTDDVFKAWCYSEMSSAYSDLDNTAQALECMNVAVELQPDDAHYLTERAVLRYILKDREGATADARKAIELGAQDDDAKRAEAVAGACDLIAQGKGDIKVVERNLDDNDEGTLPEFPGGREAMKQFIQDNIKYPKKAAKKGVHGEVLVECCFDLEGNMIASQVLEGVSKELDNEALRVVQAMPKFSPGMLKGEPCWSRMFIKVKFNKPLKKNKKR